MPVFAYRAVDAGGRRSRGRLAATTPDAVARELESRGLLALDVRSAEGPASPRAVRGFGHRRAVLEFTRGVAALLPAGMPLPRAVSVAAESAPASVQGSLTTVRERVQRGDELHVALADHPALFSPLYLGVVRAGERSGALEHAFERLAGHLEREDELRSKLVSMSIYPAVLGLVGLASVLVLVLFVLPRFADLLEGSGAALPRSTAWVLASATAVQDGWLVLAAIAAAGLAGLVWARATPPGRRAASRVLAGLPVVGAWRRQTLAARFARMTGELLAGGAPLLSALRDTGECMGDPLAREETERIRARVREGGALNRAISERAYFPATLPQLVALGEEAGRLAEFLLKAAELLERRTERALERMVALAEPAMIVAFGGIVAVVALSLLQAIYGVNPGGLR